MVNGILSMAAIGVYLANFNVGFAYVCRSIYATLLNVLQDSWRGSFEPRRRITQKDVDTTSAVIHVVLIMIGVSAYLALAYAVWELVMNRILQAL